MTYQETEKINAFIHILATQADDVSKTAVPKLLNMDPADFEEICRVSSDIEERKEDKRINGYRTLAQVHRKHLGRLSANTQDAMQTEKKILALDIMADLDPGTQKELFNSGAFNDVVRGYVKMAMDNIDMSQSTQQAVIDDLNILFDEMTAAEAEEYYTNN